MSNYQPPPPQPNYQPAPPQPSSMGHGVRIGVGIVIGIFVVILLSMGACVACGGLMLGIGARKAEERAASAAEPTSLARHGQRVERNGIAITVENVAKQKSLSRFQTADPNNTYLVVDVLLETVDRNETPYNPLYFKVKDGDGIEYNSALGMGKGALSSGKLYKGDKVRGTVAFEVREKARQFVLTYEPLVLLGGYEPIRILLE